MTDYRPAFYAHYHTAVGSAEAVDETHWRRCARQFHGRWAQWLPPDKTSAMLDLGCGCGEWLYYLRSMGYENVIGVDVCDGELVRARQMGIVDLISVNALEYLEDKKECFDVISAFNFFEHMRKDEVLRLLRLIYGALKPGGKLLAVTPNGLSPFGGATRYWDFSHETGFTPASWGQIARIGGFSEIHFEEYGPIPHSVFGIVRVVLWQLVRLGIQIVSYIEVGGPRDISRVYTADMKVILVKQDKG